MEAVTLRTRDVHLLVFAIGNECVSLCKDKEVICEQQNGPLQSYNRIYLTSRNIAALGSIMDVLYAKLLVVVGIAVPVATNLNHRIPVAPDQITDVLASFCLRLGAVVFGAGSLVFTRLQIGAEIASGPFRTIISDIRLLLVTAQMHFIFLNGKNLESANHAVPS